MMIANDCPWSRTSSGSSAAVASSVTTRRPWSERTTVTLRTDVSVAGSTMSSRSVILRIVQHISTRASSSGAIGLSGAGRPEGLRYNWWGCILRSAGSQACRYARGTGAEFGRQRRPSGLPACYCSVSRILSDHVQSAATSGCGQRGVAMQQQIRRQRHAALLRQRADAAQQLVLIVLRVAGPLREVEMIAAVIDVIDQKPRDRRRRCCTRAIACRWNGSRDTRG